MKKLLLILAFAMAATGFSQAISVNTSNYSVPQLVNNVLINSPCVSATNITWKTGTNYGSTNGIGYFQNSNPNFPMTAGVILSTGDVSHAAGPNSSILNDGSANWPGDNSLESTLAQSGIAMHSVNASILEFDFTPISPAFSFDFLFASEEYGNFQCQFSDAFAFLLTNTSTGVTTNLAVVPNTTLPISVVTIRDYLYNSSCPSANAQYFGSYNGGSAAAGSATNYNGQTKLLNASATLVPNTTYHIKLVIADRFDQNSDSAIFLSSNSFNIGQDVLGPDLTAANNSSLCPGSTHVLNSNLDPAIYTFSWTQDGVTVPGANGPTLSITQPGVYGLTYQKTQNGCNPLTNFITVEYSGALQIQSPIDLYKCNNGNPTLSYDLSMNTPIVKQGLDPLTHVTYFASATDADNNANALPIIYSSAPGQTVYVRVQSANSSCYVVKSFQLLTTAPPVANVAGNMTRCSGSAFNNAPFDLTQQNQSVLNGQSSTINTVSYYTSLANANSATSPINNSFIYANNNTTVYVRVQNATDNSCFSVSSFTLFVSPLPPVDVLPDVVICDGYTLPALTNGNYFSETNGTGQAYFAGDIITQTKSIYIFNQPGGPGSCSAQSSFTVTIIDPHSIVPPSDNYCGSYTLPSLVVGHYYTQTGGGGTEIPSGTTITATQTIYVYYHAPVAPFCLVDEAFTATILPTANLGTFDNVFDCTSYTLPHLTTGNYFTETGGAGTQIAEGTVLTTSQTIYVYATTSNNCTAEASFEVVIGITTPTDISQCEPYTLPALPIGSYYTGPVGSGQEIPAGTVINASQTIYVYVHTSAANCTDNIHFSVAIAQPVIDILTDITACDSYTLPTLVSGDYFTGLNGTGTPLHAGDLITSSQTIYIFKQSTTANCNNQSSFQVTINPKPAIDSRSDIDICNSYELTTLSVGNYYTGPHGTGTMLPGGTIITTSQTIYIYAVSPTFPDCTAENSFQIHIYSIEADAPANVVACDSYTLPALTIGNYFAASGGPSVGEGNMMHAGDVITSSRTIYVYTESGERINCTDENSFTVTINTTPVLTPFANVNAINSYILPSLTQGDYYTGPNKTGTLLHSGDAITSNQTVYVYAETGTVPNCYDEKSFTVTVFNVDHLGDVTTCVSYTLPELNIGNYYTGPQGTGNHLVAGQTVTTSETVYIYSVAPFDATKYDESSFNVTIVSAPVVYPVSTTLLTVCDEDGTNDGITNFTLSSLDTAILGTQTSSEYVVTYHASFDDAVAGVNAITSTNLATVYVRVTNTLTASCFDVKSLSIIVNKLPIPSPIGGTMCYDTKNQILLNPFTISSGLPSSGYSFQWTNETGAIVATSSSYTAILPGVYTVVATNTATGCTSAPASATVVSSEPAIVSYAVTEDFSDNQTITVEAAGVGGAYEYQLDFGPFQDSPLFENVSSGEHKVTVRDKNGCGISTSQAFVVNYPKFFTPNGDGYNDTWNITDLKDKKNASILIYDRYGKLMSQIQPSGAGWDGTFSGQVMPSTDYWFTLNYTEDGTTKEFKAHFAMKR